MVLTDPTGHSWVSTQVNKINSWADKNPWGAFAVQQFSSIIGTALLTRTETGRHIIAGEIIVGTAAGAAVFGGPVWSGALSGELTGGYSAYRSGGSILSGVAVGGVVGAGTGYLGQQVGTVKSPMFSNPGGEAAAVSWGSKAGARVAGQFILRGATEQAGSGFINAYAGGKGSWNEMLNGTLRGAARGAVVNGAIVGGTYLIDRYAGGSFSISNLELQGEFSKEKGWGIYSWQMSNHVGRVNLVNVDIRMAGVYSDYGNTYNAMVGAEMSSPFSLALNTIANIATE